MLARPTALLLTWTIAASCAISDEPGFISDEPAFADWSCAPECHEAEGSACPCDTGLGCQPACDHCDWDCAAPGDRDRSMPSAADLPDGSGPPGQGGGDGPDPAHMGDPAEPGAGDAEGVDAGASGEGEGEGEDAGGGEGFGEVVGAGEGEGEGEGEAHGEGEGEPDDGDEEDGEGGGGGDPIDVPVEGPVCDPDDHQSAGDPAVGEALTPGGAAITRHVCAGADDWYLLDAVRGAGLRVEVARATTTVAVRLYDPAGALRVDAISDNAGAASLSVHLVPAAGRWTLRVRSLASDAAYDVAATLPAPAR